jgi:hypothetical protein
LKPNQSYLIEDLEKAAHAIAKKAIDLAFDPDYISPFAVSAKKNIGINIRGMCVGFAFDLVF